MQKKRTVQYIKKLIKSKIYNKNCLLKNNFIGNSLTILQIQSKKWKQKLYFYNTKSKQPKQRLFDTANRKNDSLYFKEAKKFNDDKRLKQL